MDVQARAVEVVWADTATAPVWWFGLLDAAERVRVRPGVLQQRRAEIAVGAALLRLVVGKRLGISPIRVQVDRTCATCGSQHGRPRVLGPGEDAKLDVSVSHAAGSVVVAVVERGRVGVDVAVVPPAEAVADVGPSTTHPDENVSSPADFAVIWTRKEAIVKCDGVGLRVDLRDVRVTEPSQPPRLLVCQFRPPLVESLQLFDLAHVPASHRAALAVEAPGLVTVVERAVYTVR